MIDKLTTSTFSKIVLVSIFFVGAIGLNTGCTHSRCRGDVKDVKSELPSSLNKQVEKKLEERAMVYKPDGSLQCGDSGAIPVVEMQKELLQIKVYSANSLNDGAMRIQLCGAPTGNNNVYEIDKKDLEAALRMGFKPWTF